MADASESNKPPSALEELNKIREERATLDERANKIREDAKTEILAVILAKIAELKELGFDLAKIAELKELGFDYPQVEGKAQTRKTNPEKPCPICKFRTEPVHDRRAHKKVKKPFSDWDLGERKLTKVET
jgi:hypothetical protein